MRKLSIALAATAFMMFAPQGVAAQITIGPTLALHDDADFGIGGTIGAMLPSLGEGIGFMGDVIIFFPGDASLPVVGTVSQNYLEVNANITYDFPLENSTLVPFALGGLNIARASVDVSGAGGGSNTDVGLNLGGGITFDAGNFRPSVAGRFEVSGGEGFVVFVTLPFAVGDN